MFPIPRAIFAVCLFLGFSLLGTSLFAQQTVLRINQAGYLPDDSKLALVMSKVPLKKKISVYDQDHKLRLKIKAQPTSGNKWGSFPYQYTLDLSELQKEGTYQLSLQDQTWDLSVQQTAFQDYEEVLLSFMRQQRCGYNPYFGVVCHKKDGKLFYAPVEDSTYYDFSGGWHDAGDQLKYLITSSNATARMLITYLEYGEKFDDKVDELGHPYPNGRPDILDEAKWGLEWLLKIHPKPDWLIHQIADDRDHRGFKYPDQDNADYGWGPNSYRVAYFADGKPQGLGKWKSASTGLANLAGRTAAALALGARVFQAGPDSVFALQCQQAAISLYKLGKKHPGFQQGNSYGAPYRYNEDSWEDDMEFAAAELYKLSGESTYMDDAIHYANLIQDKGWMAQDSMWHYQKYPFMNMGHYSLYEVAPEELKSQLASWYKSNIENVIRRAETHAFHIGIPFIWCSNNLLVNFITQVILYEKMSGDLQFHQSMLLHRDWLMGRNPWGTSMFTLLPENGEYPLDVHLPSRYLMKKTPAGGLIDGPIYRSIYDNLIGLKLNEPDEFEAFQNDFIVYHDDLGDYSTNEPTMDGTADAIFIMAHWSHE